MLFASLSLRQDLIRTGGQREHELSELERAAFLQSTLIQKIQDNLDYDNQYFAIGISASHNVNNRPLNTIPKKMAGLKASWGCIIQRILSTFWH